MKKYISMIAALLCLAVFAACGRGYTPMPLAEETTSTTMTETEAKTVSYTMEEVMEEADITAESIVSQTSAAAATTAAAKISTATAVQRTTAITTSKVSSTNPTTVIRYCDGRSSRLARGEMLPVPPGAPNGPLTPFRAAECFAGV